MKIIHEGDFSCFSIYLTIGGRLPNFDLITQEIGIVPILTARIKKKIRELSLNNDALHDLWGIGFENKPFACLSEAFEEFIGSFSGGFEKIRSYSIKNGFELSLHAKVVVKDYVPLLDLTSEVMKWMVDLGTYFFLDVSDPEHNLD